MDDSAKSRVIGAYASPLVRGYCYLRFRVMKMRLLEEISQYIPEAGRILDIGCGFGLFTLYYSLLSPDRKFVSLDLNESRINLARSAMKILGISNQATFEARGAETLSGSPCSFDAAYMLDLIHHIPRETHEILIGVIHEMLVPGGILILKDVATTPRWKMGFTWLMDRIMNPSQPPNYVDTADMRRLLTRAGFDVKIHALRDILPFPHVLYVCRKSGGV